MNLYEIPYEAEAAMKLYLNCFDLETGELIAPEEVAASILLEIEKLQNQKDQALSWILRTRGNAEANIKTLENEIERLKERIHREKKTSERMEILVKRFIPEAEKPVQVDNFTISYTKSQGTVINDVTLLPENLQIKKLVPTADLMPYEDALKDLGVEFSIDITAAKKEVKEWLESLPPEEYEKVKDNSFIEHRRTLKIK